jgi:hypothetical protein
MEGMQPKSNSIGEKNSKLQPNKAILMSVRESFQETNFLF